MLKTVARRKIRDVVADQLKSYITEQGLKPGDRLPTETSLAEQFGVSRLSLREATKALEFLGIVESKPGVGLTIGQVDFQRVTACLGWHPGFQETSPAELVETRIVIETGVLPYVARNMQAQPAIYDSLVGVNDRLRQARDVAAWVEGDIAFHRGVVQSSGLTPLMAFNDVLNAFFHRFRESVERAEWHAGVESHQAMLDHLRAGNVAAASDELESHIQSHLRRLGN